MDFRSVIAKRREGGIHTTDELRLLVQGASSGEIPDYQLAAWLMAAYLRPLTDQETAVLTLEMAGSGERVNLAGVPKPWVDKHSTGGVGDKTTIVLAPLLAACGLSVVKMSGKGLGITGGTIDKLSCIPGFSSDLAPEQMIEQSKKIGIALAGQSSHLAPADKALYALRDVTETVSSLPLIVSSILSKKIAGGAETIVLDVKCGSGSFNPTMEAAEKLSSALVSVGQQAGLKVFATITDMHQPLGSAVGNALEVKEAIEVLSKSENELSGSTKRFRELCRYFAALTLRVSGISHSAQDALARVEDTLNSGRALAKAEQWIQAQGATVNLTDLSWIPQSNSQLIYRAGASGCISKIDAKSIGEIALNLGAGRKQKNDVIDLAVGLEIHAKVGDFVVEGQDLVTIHAKDEHSALEAEKWLSLAIQLQTNPVPPQPVVLRPA
jgi:pyrimidine-nucleoside phosphorylase